LPLLPLYMANFIFDVISLVHVCSNNFIKIIEQTCTKLITSKIKLAI